MKGSDKFKFALIIAMLAIIPIGCRKNNDTNTSADIDVLKEKILTDLAGLVCQSSYEDLSFSSGKLLVAVQSFRNQPNDTNLDSCRFLWKAIRQTWERSEAWLIGPVESNDIDPRIDTWPVDFHELDQILNSPAIIDETYVSGLEESLKGFHPIEYLLWGKDGDKKAVDMTGREMDFLLALTQNLDKLTNEVKATWLGGYTSVLSTAGMPGNATYPTRRSAFEALVDGMAGICDEVANAKIKDPFELQDPSQEESPFSGNSISDFTNNIKGVLMMYQCNFSKDGNGLEDLVRNQNLSLDNEIKTKHLAAIAALQAITDQFGKAIISQQTEIVNAMARINELADVINLKLKPFIQQYGS